MRAPDRPSAPTIHMLFDGDCRRRLEAKRQVGLGEKFRKNATQKQLATR